MFKRNQSHIEFDHLSLSKIWVYSVLAHELALLSGNIDYSILYNIPVYVEESDNE